MAHVGCASCLTDPIFPSTKIVFRHLRQHFHKTARSSKTSSWNVWLNLVQSLSDRDPMLASSLIRPSGPDLRVLNLLAHSLTHSLARSLTHSLTLSMWHHSRQTKLRRIASSLFSTSSCDLPSLRSPTWSSHSSKYGRLVGVHDVCLVESDTFCHVCQLCADDLIILAES